MRGVWVVTINNIDWPPLGVTMSAQQRRELVRLFDSLQAVNINAVLFQARPASDAMYQSDIEPWSHWLTGSQGKAPDPLFDPLADAVAEARKRGMEIYAWINPYRAVANTQSVTLSPKHVAMQSPGLLREYPVNGFVSKILDPGAPETVTHVVKVVSDILRRYDVDGIVLDDYFYPYPQKNVEFPDSETYKAFGVQFPLKEWRRRNTEKLIRALRDSVRSAKPGARFGVSPFGIWRNWKDDDRGSWTDGFDSYDGLGADTRRWLMEGLVDFLAPQIYWEVENQRAPYASLLRWWNSLHPRRHLVAGQALYKLEVDKGNWQTAEIGDQILINRILPNVRGSILFSARQLMMNTKGINDYLRANAYQRPALPPAFPWIDSTPPVSPDPLTITIDDDRIRLKWDAPASAADGDKPIKYAIYRSEESPIGLKDPEHLIAITGGTSFSDKLSEKAKRVFYGVTAVDKCNNESRIAAAMVDLP